MSSKTDGDQIMSEVCPFLKESCIKQGCVMFKNEKCLIITFLGEDAYETIKLLQTGSSEPPSQPTIKPLFEEKAMQEYGESTPNELDSPDWIRGRSPEEITNMILEYAEQEYLDKQREIPFSICQLFLYDKGKIELQQLPTETVLRLELVEALVNREIKKLEKERKEKMLEGIKKPIDSLLADPIVPKEPQINIKESQGRENSKDVLVQGAESSETDHATEKPEEKNSLNKENVDRFIYGEASKIPAFIVEGSPDRISAKILEYLDSKETEQNSLLSANPHKLFELFLLKNGVAEFELPSDMERKMRIAKSLVLEELMRRGLDKKRQEHLESAERRNINSQDVVLQGAPEAIAKDILSFVREENPEINLQDISSNIWELFDHFRKVKAGGSQFSRETEEKLDSAFVQLRVLVNKEKTKFKEQRIASEKSQLQSIAVKCASWAKANGMKKIAKYEMYAFLSEEKLDLLEETKRDLHSVTNLLLKSSKLA